MGGGRGWWDWEGREEEKKEKEEKRGGGETVEKGKLLDQDYHLWGRWNDPRG